MTIVDTKGNKMDRYSLDYSKGRLLQSKNDIDTYVYTTFAEIPQGEGYGETNIEEE